MKFLTENNIFSLPIKSAFGMAGSYLAAISPNMHDVQWWVSFVGTCAGTGVALASFVSITLGVIRQKRKLKKEAR